MLLGSVALSVFLLVVGVLATSAVLHRKPLEPPPSPPPIPTSNLPPPHAAPEPRERIIPFSAKTGIRPIAGRIDGDAEEDFVAVFRRADGLHELVAVDGLHHDPIWRRPLGADVVIDSTRTILKSVGDARSGDATILLAGDETVAPRGRLRAFSMRTGLPVGAWKLDSPIRQLCPFDEGTKNVWIETTAKPDRTLDLTTNTMAPITLEAGSGRGCVGRRDAAFACASSNRHHGWPCVGNGRKEILGTALAEAYESFETSDRLVNVGWSSPAPSPPIPSPDHAVFWDKEKQQVIWQGPLTLPDDEVASDVQNAMFADSFATTYKTRFGLVRVVIRDLTGTVTSKDLWFGAIFSSSSIQALHGTERALYMAFEDRISITIARTSVELRGIEAVP